MPNNSEYSVLVVEDNFLNAKFIEKSILHLGHKVVGNVTNGEEALEIAKRKPIDFVFMDINLEGAMDGITCARQLNCGKNIPIIYISALDDSEIIEEATDTNIYGYLLKPFTQKDIEVSLSVAIKRFFMPKAKKNDAPLNLGKYYCFCLNTKTLKYHHKVISLSKKEADMLYCFVSSLNQNITYDALIEKVWKEKKVSPSTIRDTVLRLRKKAPTLAIETISSVGYCLKVL